MQEPRDILIRIPLIGRVNSTPEDIEPFIKRINSVRGKETGAELKIEFLPYHEYGRTKWEQCGKAYQMKNAFVEEETLLQFSNSFRERGFKVVQT